MSGVLEGFRELERRLERVAPTGTRSLTGPPTVYPQHLAALNCCCQNLLDKPGRRAILDLSQFVLEFVDQKTPNPELLAHLVAESLMQRFEMGLIENRNVYVQQLEISQTAMFYLMAKAIPFVGAGHQLANLYLTHAIGEAREATLLDIGTGRGVQLEAWLKALAVQRPQLESLAVVAIDPVIDNLQQAERALAVLGRRLPFELFFYPVCQLIEDFSDTDLASLRALVRGPLLINSAFTMHHTRHPLDDQRLRTLLLARLRGLAPLAIVLVEPSSNHDTEDLPLRLHACWNHFGNLFELVDESSMRERHKFAVKAHFFGREIRDLFGVEDHYRCERHEQCESWMYRLEQAGFAPLLAPIELAPPAGQVDFEAQPGVVRMRYRGTTMVAVLAYGTPGAVGPV